MKPLATLALTLIAALTFTAGAAAQTPGDLGPGDGHTVAGPSPDEVAQPGDRDTPPQRFHTSEVTSRAYLGGEGETFVDPRGWLFEYVRPDRYTSRATAGDRGCQVLIFNYTTQRYGFPKFQPGERVTFEIFEGDDVSFSGDCPIKYDTLFKTLAPVGPGNPDPNENP